LLGIAEIKEDYKICSSRMQQQNLPVNAGDSDLILGLGRYPGGGNGGLLQ